MAAIYPILNVADQIDEQIYVARKLTETDEFDVPMVAFARVTDAGELKYTSWKAVRKHGHGLPQVEKRAMKALAQRDPRPGWQRQDIDYQGNDVTIVYREGDYLTASDALDPEILKIAASFFSSNQIFLGVPTQNFMVASSAGEYILPTIKAHYESAEEHNLIPLSPNVYCIEKGEIVGIAEFEPTPPAAEANTAPTPAARDTASADPAPPVPQLYNYEGANALWFTLTCNGYAEVYHCIQSAFQMYGPKAAAWEGCQGRMVFHVEPGPAALTAAEHAGLMQLQNQLTATAVEYDWQSPYGDPIYATVLLPQPGQTAVGSDPEANPGAPPPDAESAPESEQNEPSAPPTKQQTDNAPQEQSRVKRKSRKKTLKRTRTGSGRKTRSTRHTRTGRGSHTRGQKEMQGAQGPLTPAQLRRSIPNKLSWAIISFRIFYISLVLGLLSIGGCTAALGSAAGSAVEQQNAANTAIAATGETETGMAVPAATDPAMGAGDDTIQVQINSDADPRAAGLLFLATTAFIGVLVCICFEFILLAGLKKLRGWGRYLGIFTSVTMVLGIATLPFGAFALLGLVDGGTAQLFAEAKRLRRERQLV